jgi:hypothetical protein
MGFWALLVPAEEVLLVHSVSGEGVVVGKYFVGILLLTSAKTGQIFFKYVCRFFASTALGN